MKRLLPLLLVMLILCGCGAESEETTGSTAASTAAADQGLYDPDSAVEAQTGGAVRAYPLEADNYCGIAAMGSRLLLLSDDGSLTVLQGEVCKETATVVTGTELSSYSVSFDTTAQGVAYYLQDSREVVLLNPQLQETNRIQLPEDIQGEPAISLADQEIYYCVPGQVRAWNIQTGISRLVRSHAYDSHRLVGCYFDDTVLACEVYDGQAGAVLYISAQTGQLLSDEQGVMSLQTAGQAYLAEYQDGIVAQAVFGQREGEGRCLNVDGVVTSALPMGGAVAYSAGESGLQLSFYDLESGKRTAAVSMTGVGDPAACLATQKHVWILACENEHQVLYRWDVSQSAVTEDTVCTGPLYTAANPDTAGLAACQKRADEMNKKYGVRIHIWQDAVKEPGEYALVPEHQVTAINSALDELEPALALFPEKFLQKTVEAGWIRICLVRSTGADTPFVQYWADGDCYIAIAYDALDGNPGDAFVQGAAYAIDSHVLGNSRDFDTWDSLNPEGFAYDYDHTLTAQRQDAAAYLEGENRAFVDQMSMSFPNEDRSRLFAAAMTEGNAGIFASATMQAKLLRLCQGIREGYGLDKSEETFLWEQYLTGSLAYEK